MNSRLQLGRELADFFVANVIDPLPGDPRENATQWLLDKGYERVEWARVDDDILLCLLWKTEDGEMQDFIIEFAGHDALEITLFEWKDQLSL